MDIRTGRPKDRLSMKGSIYKRVRSINIALFVLAFVMMFALMLSAFNIIVNNVSADNASRYAASTSDAFSANVVREIGLMGKAAHSTAIGDWLAAESDPEKKNPAFDELKGVVKELNSTSLYVVVKDSLNFYSVTSEDYPEGFRPFETIDIDDPIYAWFFDAISSGREYLIYIGMDTITKQNRVWLNYNVDRDGETIGTLTTWLDFSYIAGELFSQYDAASLRGLIIDEHGVINLDSAYMGDQNFEILDIGVQIEKELSDPLFLETISSHLDSVEGVFEERGEPIILALGNKDPYRFATITEIRATPWSVVLLYNPSSFLSMSVFLPIIAVLLFLLLIFALSLNLVSRREIFRPLERLVRSLENLREDSAASVYGVDRDDEIGNLSTTIVDLFTKANYDTLTGIHNRNYMEATFQSITHLLSRSDGVLSVLMLDVDFFKKYNDEYGHDKGDVCLRMVAQALSDNVSRKGDFVARYGGEEFIAILPNTDEAGARLMANRLLKAVRSLLVPHSKSAVAEHVTISIGATTGKVLYAQTGDELVRRADEALYKAKQTGRDRYVFIPLDEKDPTEDVILYRR